jgi:thiol-disulfide isomerase/thioredoxin
MAVAALAILAACTGSAPVTTPPGASTAPSAPGGSSPGATPSGPSQNPAESLGPLTSDPLHTVELYDVNAEATFTLGALAAERPVLLEMMAIWCTNCRAQQREVVAAHDLAAFHSVSLDVDPNERPGDLALYSEELGFKWRFAMANQTLAVALRERFGTAVLNPPSTPMILLFPDGSVRALEFRGYSAAELAAEIAAG